MIVPYLGKLRSKLQEACRQAINSRQEVSITYAVGRCDMGANRDYWDETYNGYVCGFNPPHSEPGLSKEPADDTVLVARMTDLSGELLATLVNYGCHPTTLAWENMLISPDYVGAMREQVELVTGHPCVFAQGACADLGPKNGYVGDVAVADRNGRHHY